MIPRSDTEGHEDTKPDETEHCLSAPIGFVPFVAPMSVMVMMRRLFIACAGFAFLLDQLTKLLVTRLIPAGEMVRVVGDYLRFFHASNQQGVFGLSYGPRVVYILLPLAGAVLVVLFALKARDRWSATAFGLILGGALGNLVDRLHAGGGVIDFIDMGWRSWRWFTYNLADVFLVVGIIMMLSRELLRRAAPPADTPVV